jgi:GT2 family glycosyltransferase
MTRYPHVGIVVINWKRPDCTVACLDSLAALDYPSYQVVVVNNGSENGFGELLRDRFPAVLVIENGRNVGFARGNNIGIEHLLRSGADYVLLLNDDTEVAPDLLGMMVQAAEEDSRIGIVGPKIYYYDQPDVIWSAGGAVDRFGQASHLRVDEHDDGSAQTARDVDYVTGCAMLVRRTLIDRVGVLDERFFAYFEETEWCVRARRAGFRVVYVSQARMWHKLKAETRGHSTLYQYLMSRNRLLYLKCTGAGPWIIARAALGLLRTAASWSLRPRHREMRPLSGALVRGVGHFVIGRFGAPPRSL